MFFLGLVMFAVLLFLLASFAFGRGEEMAPAPPDSTPVELPDDRPVRGTDVRDLRLSVAVRGYRMREVDWVLEQLAIALDDRDRQLAELRPAESPPQASAFELDTESVPDVGDSPAREEEGTLEHDLDAAPASRTASSEMGRTDG